MVLTSKQEEGLKIAVERHRLGERYTTIAGYAGTGKSTLVKFIIEALQVEPSKVCYATYTGKAAQVLVKKGNKNAITLHRLLYDSFPLPAGGFYRKKKPFIEYDVVVVDEVSMAPKELMDILFSHNAYVICLGDPFQLPPIDKDQDNHLLDKPHIFLDEIMRQAAESEIIRLTMDIRAGKPLELFKGSEVQILDKSSLVDGIYTWADQILVATNNRRHEINDFMRQKKGFGKEPCVGDKVICLRNYWEDYSMGIELEPLVNGTIGYLMEEPEKIQLNAPRYVYQPGVIDALSIHMMSDSDQEYLSYIDPNIIHGRESVLTSYDKYKLGKAKNRIGDVIPREFAYAYAITVHKSQGSEWDKVLVMEENFPRDKMEHARWLYTACTRAAEKLVVIRK